MRQSATAASVPPDSGELAAQPGDKHAISLVVLVALVLVVVARAARIRGRQRR